MVIYSCLEMKHWLGLLLLFTFVMKGSSNNCTPGNIKCGDGKGCATYLQVCDDTDDCIDGSDEDSDLCTVWPSLSQQTRCSGGNFYCKDDTFNYKRYACMDLKRACASPECSPQIKVASSVCKILSSGALPSIYPKLSTSDVRMLQDAVNSTLDHPACPMLYTRVAGQCLAIFPPCRLTWSEANQFCGVIFGELATFPNITSFASLQRYLIAKEMTSEFWIGGRYQMAANRWNYIDGTKMPLGTPYWAVRHADTCRERSSSDIKYCYDYYQSPTNELGYCSALTYELYYYISDESCLSKKIPICVFTGKKSGEWVNE